MIKPGYVQAMARYNRWQNKLVDEACDTLTTADLNADRGAFFGSIQATLSHLLWGDTMWMSRFDGWEQPPVTLGESPIWISEWDEYASRREAADAAILDWAGRVTQADLDGALSWYSGAASRDMEMPFALCVMHFFNHQTHHRGQVHAMLTAAGASPGVTDLVFMPSDF